MKKSHFRSLTTAVVLLALLCFILTISLTVLRDGAALRAVSVGCALFSSCAVLLMLPVGHDKAWLCLLFAALLALTPVVCALTGAPAGRELALVSAVLLAGFCVLGASRYESVLTLFKQQAALYAVQNDARQMYALLLLLLGLVLYAAEGKVWLQWLIVTLLGAFMVLMLIRWLLGVTLYISPAKEKCIMGLAEGQKPLERMKDDGEKMRVLFERVQRIMEEDKPYLDPKFELQDLASMAYTNKTYLSRTINLISGKNFCQFVNTYRIDYAAGLCRMDPASKVEAISRMSGFNSCVTFTMAFKVNMGETPGEYLSRMLDTVR